MINIKEIYEKHQDNIHHDEFKGIPNKFSSRPDIHAFILLDKLLPGNHSIIAAAEHDQIWLDTDMEKIAEVATEEQIIELMKCGVMYDEDTESFFMFA